MVANFCKPRDKLSEPIMMMTTTTKDERSATKIYCVVDDIQIITIHIQILIFASVAEGSCKMDYESGCLKRMSIQFQERIVTEKREFTIYYKETEDKNGKN